jgi:hypothetical protein
MKQLLFGALLLSTAVLVHGCIVAAVGAGAGTIAYMKGDLEAVEAKSVGEVYEAATKAVKELEMTISESSKDALGGKIVASDAGGKKVTILLKAKTENSTKLSVRVGTFGSRLIYDKIKENL